jgi:hypothetical protein
VRLEVRKLRRGFRLDVFASDGRVVLGAVLDERFDSGRGGGDGGIPEAATQRATSTHLVGCHVFDDSIQKPNEAMHISDAIICPGDSQSTTLPERRSARM